MKLLVTYMMLGMVLLALILLSLSIGTLPISVSKIMHFMHHKDTTIESILLDTIRIPRTGCAIIVGAALALTGVILFYISRNELGCPSLLGINQGVFVGVIASVVLTQSMIMQNLFLSGILAGTSAGLVTFLISFKLGFSPLKLILIGQAINLFCYALCQLLLMLAPQYADSLLVSLNGSLANSNWALLETFGSVLFLTSVLAIVFMKQGYLLSLGTDVAKNIGVHVNRILFFFLGIILILSTGSVLIVGPLIFFPLLALHCSKLFISSNKPHHFALVTACVGSILLLASDLFMRVLYPDWEAPLNLFIAILGVPLLIVRARSVH
ncbi:FecCD transport family protein [Legionella gratiana]|uniref:FecCD transport family protein n=1 Tax=Legionella gratiana TaxID=45066 RepID=A0A378JCT8_9GAMM|nr:iron ABC transporter permease [Legionella gratiana]KTD09162.1 FecCD transport family protein [Legionella gratiana]STX45623.1 FecCD transport family protein [Legionella gratiana]